MDDHHHRPEKRCRITPPPPVAGVALPEDLLFMEVLVRLPVELLVRFKCVCRSWRARMEEDGAFIRRHRDFPPAPTSMLVISRNTAIEYEGGDTSEDIAFHCLRLRPGQRTGDFEANAELLLEKAVSSPEAGGITDVVFATHCNGLVAVATSTNQVYVCNPATKEVVALPLGSPDVLCHEKQHATSAIGFDRWRKQYVVVRYFYRRWSYDKASCTLDYDIGHEVFTLGQGDSWELTVDPPHAIGGTPPACTGDAFYWVCDAAEDPRPRPGSLLRFNLRDRAFDLVPCPPDFAYHPALDHLAELDGKLCHVNNASLTTFDVWQLGDDDARWSLRCRIDPDGGETFGCYGFLPLWAAGGGMLVRVSDGDEKLYWCNEHGAKEVVDLAEYGDLELDPMCYAHHVVPYRESLVCIRKCKALT